MKLNFKQFVATHKTKENLKLYTINLFVPKYRQSDLIARELLSMFCFFMYIKPLLSRICRFYYY